MLNVSSKTVRYFEVSFKLTSLKLDRISFINKGENMLRSPYGRHSHPLLRAKS